MRKILVVLLITFSIKSFSQPTIEWQKSIGGTQGDWPTSIQQTSDGGYVVAGWSHSNARKSIFRFFFSKRKGDVTGNHGNGDCWVVKLNKSGKIKWQKSYGGSGEDRANSIQQTTDGGFIVAGSTNSDNGDVSDYHWGHSGNIDFWVIKLNRNGKIKWQKCFGTNYEEDAKCVRQTSDGGYIIVGYSTAYGNNGSSDYWVIKLNSKGGEQWQKFYGGADVDVPSTVIQTSDGGYILAGSSISRGSDIFGHQWGFDCWIIKIDNKGTMQWQKYFGGTGHENASAVIQTTDGGYIIAANTNSNDGIVAGNHGGNDYWVIKTDSIGSIQWQKCFGGTGSEDLHSVLQTSDGGYLLAGHSYSTDGDVTGNHGGGDFWIVKLNESGNMQWQKSLGGTSGDYDCIASLTSDGGYILTGRSSSQDGDVTGNHGIEDYWIVKLSPHK
ncbi:MAG: T9SS C-terminal target domain-containing protein [Verrucomicrobia bacterium]|nr:T9SS C-terminal target domain-containing protein [Verrucomicrobiota bacterium]